jgi:hypothetical protein
MRLKINWDMPLLLYTERLGRYPLLDVRQRFSPALMQVALLLSI